MKSKLILEAETKKRALWLDNEQNHFFIQTALKSSKQVEIEFHAIPARENDGFNSLCFREAIFSLKNPYCQMKSARRTEELSLSENY